MEKIIYLLPQSQLDDVKCADGELLNADFLFESDSDSGKDPDEGGNGSGSGSGSEDSSPEVTTEVSLREPLLPVPEGAVPMCMHIPPGSRQVNAIILLSDGSLAFAPDAMFSQWDVFSPSLTEKVVRVAPVGQFLSILTVSSLFFARFDGTTYRWLGTVPAPPEGEVQALPAAIPPFSYVASDFPSLNVSVTVDSADSDTDVLDWLAGRSDGCSQLTRLRISEGIKEAFADFMERLKGSGLFFSPVVTALCWRLADGSRWLQGERRLVGVDSSGVALAITSASCTSGLLNLTLSVSRRPFTLSSPPQSAIPFGWESIIEGVDVLCRSVSSDVNASWISAPIWVTGSARGFMVGSISVTPNFSDFTDVFKAIHPISSVPDDIFSVGNRLIALFHQSETRTAEFLSTSIAGIPAVCTGEGALGGAPVIALVRSSRSFSSGSAGEIPLYAFCRDGIRAISPSSKGGFSDSQLISRHVVFSRDCIAPLPGGVAFVNQAGIFRLEGSSVSLIKDSPIEDFTLSLRLHYLYEENALVVSDNGQALCAYGFNSSRWYSCSGKASESVYAWPSCRLVADSTLGIATLKYKTESTPNSSSPSHLSPLISHLSPLIPIKTRPLKLGNPFSTKKLGEIEVLSPDGTLLPVKVYGAMRLGKWYFLGMNPRGRMRLRGSGWRFFVVETMAVQNGSSYFLPVLRLVYD